MIRWFNGLVRRLSCLLALSFLCACKSDGQHESSTGDTNTQSKDPLESVSFTLSADRSSSEGETTEVLNCEERAQAYAKALQTHWPAAATHGGLILAVRSRDCAPWTGSVGTAEPGTPLDSDHALAIGGLGQVLSSAAILALVDRDRDKAISDPARVDHYDLVSKYLPKISDATLDLRALMSQLRSVASYTRDQALVQSATQDPSKSFSAQELLEGVLSKATEKAPTKGKFIASPSNTAVLDHVVASASGSSTPDFIRTKIIAPTSAQGIHLWDKLDDAQKIAPGWSEQNGSVTRRDSLVSSSFRGAAAGSVATAAGLAHWLEAFTTSSMPLTPDSLSLMMRRTDFVDPDLDTQWPEMQGYGFKIWSMGQGIDAFGFDGLALGYASIAMTMNVKGVTVVALTNNESQRKALTALFRESLRSALAPWQPEANKPEIGLEQATPFLPY